MWEGFVEDRPSEQLLTNLGRRHIDAVSVCVGLLVLVRELILIAASVVELQLDTDELTLGNDAPTAGVR